MKKTLLLLFILVGLCVVYFGFIENDNSDGSVTIADRDFIVEDKDRIQTFTIKSKGYPLIHLSKTDDIWIVNKKYRASDHVVNNMLSVFSRMKINYLPPKTQYDMINRSIKDTGIELKTYDVKGNILSDFIMAGNTNDEDGTYCIKTGANQAYVMSMPLVKGGLRNYFSHQVNGIRDKAIFRIDTDDITAVSVAYPKNIKHSYRISKTDKKLEFELLAANKKELPEISQKVMRNYLKDFNVLLSEYISNNNPARDSIKNKIAFAEINIELADQESIELSLFPDIDIYDKSYNTISIDSIATVERFFVQSNWEDFYTLQYRLVRKLLKKPGNFTR